LRAAIRSGRFTGYTAGLAPGYAQANLCILPKPWADDFMLFSQRNPQACPVLARSDTGDPALSALGKDIDVRTDAPRYDIFVEGVHASTVDDIRSLWRDDLVTFAIGCSYTLEEALLGAGLPLRYLERGGIAPLYLTNIETRRAGAFHGPLVVTMRSFAPRDAIRAIQVSSRFPSNHGAPIWMGAPEEIGVDLDRPYKGIGTPDVAQGEVPLFWACGVTPQTAIARAKPPLCITHAPSSLLITDVRNASLAVF
jgi:uncharacterized protein YcsI (UPF0317 family)